VGWLCSSDCALGRDPGSRAKMSSVVAGKEGDMEGWRISRTLSEEGGEVA
jgi:hypothetical protein